MNIQAQHLKSVIHVAILQAGLDGMEYIHKDISDIEFRIRQQLLEDKIFAAVAGSEPVHESEVV